MNSVYNAIDPDFIQQFHDCLDDIEKNTKGPGIVVTIGCGPKVFSSGFNLNFWKQNPKNNIPLSISLLYELLKRIQSFGMPTVCCINGHAIAGGVFLAMVHDYRIMIWDPKFYFYLNELANGFVIPYGFIRLMKHKTTPQAFERMCMGNKVFVQEARDVFRLIDAVYKDLSDLDEQIN